MRTHHLFYLAVLPLILVAFQNCGTPFQSLSSISATGGNSFLGLDKTSVEVVDSLGGEEIPVGPSDVMIAGMAYKVRLVVGSGSSDTLDLNWSVVSNPVDSCTLSEVAGEAQTARTLVCVSAARADITIERTADDGTPLSGVITRVVSSLDDATTQANSLYQANCAACHAVGDPRSANLTLEKYQSALQTSSQMSFMPQLKELTPNQLRLINLVLNPDENTPAPTPTPPPVGEEPMPTPPGATPTPPAADATVTIDRNSVSAFAEGTETIRVMATGGSATCQVQSSAPNVVQAGSSQLTVASGATASLSLKIGELIDQNAPQYATVSVACNGKNHPITVRALPRGLAISFGTHHACAIDASKTLFCWGKGTDGQLGDPQKREWQTAYRVPTTLKFEVIRAGTQNNCALGTDNKVYCWGVNTGGVLGTGNNANLNGPSTPVLGLPENLRVIDIGLSNARDVFIYHVVIQNLGDVSHACALIENGDVYCWGNNNLAQLGRSGGGSSNRAVKVEGISGASALAVGGAHSCVIKGADQKVHCWGDNHAAQLGSGTTATTSSNPVALNYASKVKVVSAGAAFNCLIDVDSKLLCWGHNGVNELGKGGTSTKEANPVAVKNLNTAAGVYAGKLHACAISKDKRLYCWGDNYSGQLANGGKNNGTTAQATLITALPQLAVAAASGSNSTCAFLASNKLSCWGHGYFGETGGNRTRNDFTSPADVVGYLFR